MTVKKKKNTNIKKEDFINFLTSATKEQINQYIISKGKPAKLVKVFIRLPQK